MKNQKINNNQVLIGQPIDYPSELIILMKNIFHLGGNIQNAYLACIQYGDSCSSPKILVGLDVTGNIERVILDIKIHMKNYDDSKLEFTDAKKGQFKNYFSKIKPFYNRKS